jgi:hypothetical protein
MRPIWIAMMVAAGCGGPSMQQVVETPSAQAPARPAEAPPASGNDKDRERLVQSFEDMNTTQRAYREANQGKRDAKPPQPIQKAPVEQAPVEQPALPARPK